MCDDGCSFPHAPSHTQQSITIEAPSPRTLARPVRRVEMYSTLIQRTPLTTSTTRVAHHLGPTQSSAAVSHSRTARGPNFPTCSVLKKKHSPSFLHRPAEQSTARLPLLSDSRSEAHMGRCYSAVTQGRSSTPLTTLLGHVLPRYGGGGVCP